MTLRGLIDCLWRAAYRVGFRLALVYWRMRQPEHQGALVAVWAGCRLLLVQQSYRRELSLPGGGIRPGESPPEAASRELAEELGLHVAQGRLKPVFQTTGLFDGRRDTVFFFELHVPEEPSVKPDNREITQIWLIANNELPGLPVPEPVGRYLNWRRKANSILISKGL